MCRVADRITSRSNRITARNLTNRRRTGPLVLSEIARPNSVQLDHLSNRIIHQIGPFVPSNHYVVRLDESPNRVTYPIRPFQSDHYSNRMTHPMGPLIQSNSLSNRIILQSDHSSDRTLRPTGHFSPKSDHSSNRITNLTRPIGAHLQSEQNPRLIGPLLRLDHFTCPIGPLVRPVGSLV